MEAALQAHIESVLRKHRRKEGCLRRIRPDVLFACDLEAKIAQRLGDGLSVIPGID